jgi:quercetin dioxygenase-like cupin family protein
MINSYSVEELISLLAEGPQPMVIDGETVFMGVFSLPPAGTIPSHIHERQKETFVALAGTTELWINRDEQVVLAPGSSIEIESGVEHYLRNPGLTPTLVCYVKTPHFPDDRILTGWEPEMENPS